MARLCALTGSFGAVWGFLCRIGKDDNPPWRSQLVWTETNVNTLNALLICPGCYRHCHKYCKILSGSSSSLMLRKISHETSAYFLLVLLLKRAFSAYSHTYPTGFICSAKRCMINVAVLSNNAEVSLAHCTYHTFYKNIFYKHFHNNTCVYSSFCTMWTKKRDSFCIIRKYWCVCM